MSLTNPASPPVNPNRQFATKWHPTLSSSGHTQVSNYFLENYHRLEYGITHGEAMFIIHLMQFKWDADSPFPAYKTIADRMHVSLKTARRFGASLETKGYLKRHFRKGETNKFDLKKLMTALAEMKINDQLKPKKKSRAARATPATALP